MTVFRSLFQTLGTLVLTAAVALAQFGGPAQVPVSLVSEATTVKAGEPFTVALKLAHPQGIHTYWLNPGIGQATKIDWKLPEGWTAGAIIWPIPELYDNGAGPSHVYHGETYLLTELTPPASFTAGSSATLNAQATWFECTEENCTRATGPVSLTVTAGDAAVDAPEIKAAFDAIRAQQPQTSEAWKIESRAEADNVVVTLTPQAGANADPGEIYFFERNNAVELGAPKVEKTGNNITVTVARTDEEQPVAGFLRASKGWLADGSLPALSVPVLPATAGSTPENADDKNSAASDADVSSKNPSATENGTEAKTQPATDGSGVLSAATLAAMDAIIPQSGPKAVNLSGQEETALTFGWALLFAFLGGVILNAMPCVFPVLGLKVLGFVQQGGENAGKVRQHGLVFVLGLLVAMWLLAGVLIALKAAGQQLGWGFQQQSPGFMAIIIAVLFLLGLNLAGVFEWGTAFTGVGGTLMEKQGLAGSFFTGALTTLVATPCSGPFLGAAMGYTLQQPAALALVLFTVFGLGIGAPYLLLSLWPSLIRLLPRPGAWMETFKIAMAFPMFATVIYFLNTFAVQTSRTGLIILLTALLLLGLAAWVYGRWGAPHRTRRAKTLGLAFALLFLLGGGWLAKSAIASPSENRAQDERIATLTEQLEYSLSHGGKLPATAAKGAGPAGLAWEKWTPQRVQELRKEGKIVFADFTAEWCATCKVNEKVVFNAPGSDQVAAKFTEVNAVPLKADWTNEDPVIAEFLRRYNLYAIPVYFVYPADPSRPPIMLPEGLISQGDVIRALERAK